MNYSFRVKARNSAGWSEPSKGEVNVTLKPDCRKRFIISHKENI